MGFSEARAGRALLATKDGSATLEAALAWLEEHEDDSGIDEPLTVEELAARKSAEKTPLTEEEAQRRAYELQKKLREERVKREKQEAIEKERLRMQQSKALLEQQARLEEETRKRAILQLQKEKEEAKKERERQRELLRQDYRDRFGCEMPEDTSPADAEDRIAKMSAKEKVAFYSNALLKNYRKEDPQKLLVCLTTLRVYAINAKDNPTEPKYHRIRQGLCSPQKENAAFKSRVLPCEGVLQLLDACGFKDQGDALVIEGQPDGFVLAQAVKFFDLLIGQLRS
ncbi:UBX domain-containing protein 1-A [Cyclospora cayetanensis]|uniref:UBX domain-containing protein 1-A n=1 Tax=Cyclospora cayetanensis TaxID=88456 RepID=A0A6P6S1G9_9EIME|nr:UBX domain-containing protein 1-A [Cyclospora cayetanensis]